MMAAAYPANQVQAFQEKAEWTSTEGFVNAKDGFIELKSMELPPAPQDMEVVIKEDEIIPLKQISVTGEEVEEYTTCFGSWNFGAKWQSDKMHLSVGVIVENGLSWDDRLNFVLGGALTYTATQAKKNEIDAANKAKVQAGEAATGENNRRIKEELIKAAKERIELASGITRRTFEDLREEERIIVYRHLIKSLMTSYQYEFADNRTRHILSELLNSIFDIDKMLYFVAPEWWKPRKRAKQFLSIKDLQLDESIVTWDEQSPRKDNYLITEKSAPSPLGSSLGWLLQLDGDDLRNAFLNASWVKAVIPVRPGKELAAMKWLQNVEVEGAEGLGPNDYYISEDKEELDKIRNALGLVPGAQVTLSNALEYLCIMVKQKHDESNKTNKFPDDPEINDDNSNTYRSSNAAADPPYCSR